MLVWEYTHDPSNTETLELEVPTQWLGSETLDSVTYDKGLSDLVLGTPVIQGNRVRLSISGGSPGSHIISFKVSTASRSREATTLLNVAEA